MEPEEVVQKYFNAWNDRDGDPIVATFAEGGTYSDPAVPAPLSGEAIGAYAKGLWAAFPDLSFEMVSVAKGESGLVAAEWRMSGTHLGPFNGLPPTGRSASLLAADFVRVEGDKIRSVQSYFDTAPCLPRWDSLPVLLNCHRQAVPRKERVGVVRRCRTSGLR